MKKSSILLTIILSFFFFSSQAQEKAEKQNKVETIEIKTSAVCGMCKKTIETALYDLKGVKSADLDVPSKVVTVTYKTAAVTADDIKKAITLAGYDADVMPADSDAYKNLHGCCKKDVAH